MDARYKGICLAVLALCSVAATERTRNFSVTAPTPQIAKQVAQQAEIYRHKLAVEWLGKPLPDWRYPCTVTVNVGQIGAGGATTFVFTGNAVSDFKMNIQGPLDRILDSVLPHEVNHTIFAEHFRRPMPRWADEGAATFVEDESERRRQMLLAMQVLRTNRRIPMRSLLSIMEYPKDMQDVLHLYAEGYVLVELLIQNGGRAKFLRFLNAANVEGWDRAVDKFYGHRGIDALEQNWNQWVLAGCPTKSTPDGTMLASAEPATATNQTPNVLMRSQAPEREDVSVADQVRAAGVQLAGAQPAPRRGQDLEAPPPVYRSAEPTMLKQVDLGSETRFAENQPRRLPATGPTRQLRTRNPQQAEPDEDSFVQEDFEPQIAATRTQSEPTRNATRAPGGRHRLVTPALRADSRPQYGKAQPFPTDEELVANTAG